MDVEISSKSIPTATSYITANFFNTASYTVSEQNPVPFLSFQNVVHSSIITGWFFSFFLIQNFHIFKMSQQIPKTEPLFAGTKRSAMELSKALACLGFGAWNDLEPGK